MALLRMNQERWFINAQNIIAFGSFEKGALHVIEIPFQIGASPNENGAELFSMIVHNHTGK